MFSHNERTWQISPTNSYYNSIAGLIKGYTRSQVSGGIQWASCPSQFRHYQPIGLVIEMSDGGACEMLC